jgi:hypothetical protein
MLHKLPTELLMIIYDYCDTSTRIKMNRAFKWSYYFKNPLYKLQYKTLVKPKTFHRIASIGGVTVVLPH